LSPLGEACAIVSPAGEPSELALGLVVVEPDDAFVWMTARHGAAVPDPLRAVEPRRGVGDDQG